jgi:hypothetical protein
MTQQSFLFGQADPWLASHHVKSNPGVARRGLTVVYRGRANQAVYVRQALERLKAGGLTPYLLDYVFSMSRGGGFRKVRLAVPSEQADSALEILDEWMAEGSEKIEKLEGELKGQVGLALLLIGFGALVGWAAAGLWTEDRTLGLMLGVAAGMALSPLAMRHFWGEQRSGSTGARPTRAGPTDAGDGSRPAYMDSPAARRARSRRARRERRKG